VRALVRRHHLPHLRGNDGKTLVAIDLDEVQHKPLPARSPRGHQPVTETLARLQARIAGLEAELAAEQQRSAGHRADYEPERERADRMVATQDCLVAESRDFARASGRHSGSCPTANIMVERLGMAAQGQLATQLNTKSF
jgi:hypothetical protein